MLAHLDQTEGPVPSPVSLDALEYAQSSIHPFTADVQGRFVPRNQLSVAQRVLGCLKRRHVPGSIAACRRVRQGRYSLRNGPLGRQVPPPTPKSVLLYRAARHRRPLSDLAPALPRLEDPRADTVA